MFIEWGVIVYIKRYKWGGGRCLLSGGVIVYSRCLLKLECTGWIIS